MSTSLENLLRDARIDLVLSRIESDPCVIDQVIEQLDSKIRSIRFNSILVLGMVGEQSSPALSQLTSCLDDNDWSIRREAIRSLGNIGNVAEMAVSSLAKLVNNVEVSIRKEVAIALGKIGYISEVSISSLLTALRDIDEEVRIEAARSLALIGINSSEALSSLITRLDDISWKVRASAATSIGEIGTEKSESIIPLIKSLMDRDWRVRYRTIKTLAKFREKAVPALLKALNRKNSLIKRGAIEVLGEIKLDNSEIINALSPFAHSFSAKTRGKTIEALRSIGKNSIPTLLNTIIRSSNKRRILLIAAIGTIEDDITDKVPFLIETFEKVNILKSKKQIKRKADKGFKIRQILIYYLNILKNGILTFLNDPLSRKALVRVEISRTMGKIGKYSDLAIEVLTKALLDSKNKVRRASALSLGNIGSNAKISIPSLIDLLNDRKSDARWRAAEALGKIGISTPEVVSALETTLNDKYDHVSISAEFALDKIKFN